MQIRPVLIRFDPPSRDRSKHKREPPAILWCTCRYLRPLSGFRTLAFDFSSHHGLMFEELCDDAHEAHAMKLIHRAVLTIGVCFLGFAGFAISTRLGAEVPPSSVTYGSEQAPTDASVFGD